MNKNDLFLKKYIEDESFRKVFDSNWDKEYFDTKEERILYKLLKGFIIQKKISPKKEDLKVFLSYPRFEAVKEKCCELIESVYEIDLSSFTEGFIEDDFIDVVSKKKLQTTMKEIIDKVNNGAKLDLDLFKSELNESLTIQGVEKEKKEPNTELFGLTISRNYPPLNWIVQDILPEGLALLVGRPKLGKSLLAMDIALGVALGKNVLGKQVKKGKVLAAFLEDNGRRLKERTEKNIKDENYNPEDLNKITRIKTMPTIDQGGFKMIEDLLKENPDTKLVIIDTLGKIKPLSNRNENVYLADVVLLSPFQTLAQKYHACILFIHHQNKMKAVDIMDSVNGTTGLGGTADSILFLHKKERLDEQAKLFVISRETDSKELILNFDKERLKWDYVGEAGLVDKNETKQEILDLLKDGKPRTNKEIARDLGKNFETTRKRVKELFDAGQLLRGIGKKDSYTLPEVIEMEARVNQDLLNIENETL